MLPSAARLAKMVRFEPEFSAPILLVFSDTLIISACGHLADYPILFHCVLNRWSRSLQVFRALVAVERSPDTERMRTMQPVSRVDSCR